MSDRPARDVLLVVVVFAVAYALMLLVVSRFYDVHQVG